MLKKYFTHSNLLILIAVIAVGIFLRAYKISSNYYFSGELGKELLYIREFALSSKFPLIGMATSHTWLYYGPIYYWIMIPIFNIFNGNPFILFWVALIVSTIGLVLNYWVIAKIANKSLAIISTAIEALSPLLIWQTRLSKLHVFFWILMPIFMYLLYLIWNGKKKWILPAGIVFGIMFSFHFSQIPIFGVVFLLFWIKKDLYKFKDWAKFLLGVLIPNLTLVWKDRNLALWLPYRTLGIADKNPAGTLASLNEYFGKTILWDNRLWFIGLILFMILIAQYIFVNRKKITTDFLVFFLSSSIGLMLIANILHGSPPVHYFLPIFTATPILLGTYLSKFKLLPFFVISSIFVINLYSYFNEPLFYKSFTGNVKDTDIVSYSTLSNVASFVAKDAIGKSVSVFRVGPYDYFPDGYSQNYKYLMLIKGVNITNNGAITYTITENENGVNVQR